MWEEQTSITGARLDGCQKCPFEFWKIAIGQLCQVKQRGKPTKETRWSQQNSLKSDAIMQLTQKQTNRQLSHGGKEKILKANRL